jgi:hypothetical protein
MSREFDTAQIPSVLNIGQLHAKRDNELSPRERSEGVCAVIVSGYQPLNTKQATRLVQFLTAAIARTEQAQESTDTPAALDNRNEPVEAQGGRHAPSVLTCPVCTKGPNTHTVIETLPPIVVWCDKSEATWHDYPNSKVDTSPPYLAYRRVRRECQSCDGTGEDAHDGTCTECHGDGAT